MFARMSSPSKTARPASAPGGFRSSEQLESGFRATTPQGPKWSLGIKPKMVIGGSVPSWTESIPGPKYNYTTDNVKPRQPVFTMGTRPEMVVGATVPSWGRSIPGPKYAYNADVVKPRQPVYSMGGGGPRCTFGGTAEKGKREARPSSAPAISRAASAPSIETDSGYAITKKRPPAWSIASKPAMIIGDSVPSWLNSIPGPKYAYDADVVKARTPCFTMGKKAPTEADLMSVRSPGPIYGGTAVDPKLQSRVDSTKRREFEPSFGVGSRFDGPVAEMARSGSLNRFEKPRKSGMAQPRPQSAAPTQCSAAAD